jgi:hypothetical protein
MTTMPIAAAPPTWAALLSGLTVLLLGAAACGGVLLLLPRRRHATVLAAMAASLALAALFGAPLFALGALLTLAFVVAALLRSADAGRCVVSAVEVILFDPDGAARAAILRAVGARGIVQTSASNADSRLATCQLRGGGGGGGASLTRLLVPCCTRHKEHVEILFRLRAIPGVLDVRLPADPVQPVSSLGSSRA